MKQRVMTVNKIRNGAQRNDGRSTLVAVITLRFIPAFANRLLFWSALAGGGADKIGYNERS